VDEERRASERAAARSDGAGWWVAHAKLVEDAVELAAVDGALWSLARWEKAHTAASLAHGSTVAQPAAAVRGALLPWLRVQ